MSYVGGYIDSRFFRGTGTIVDRIKCYRRTILIVKFSSKHTLLPGYETQDCSFRPVYYRSGYRGVKVVVNFDASYCGELKCATTPNRLRYIRMHTLFRDQLLTTCSAICWNMLSTEGTLQCVSRSARIISVLY